MNNLSNQTVKQRFPSALSVSWNILHFMSTAIKFIENF